MEIRSLILSLRELETKEGNLKVPQQEQKQQAL